MALGIFLDFKPQKSFIKSNEGIFPKRIYQQKDYHFILRYDKKPEKSKSTDTYMEPNTILNILTLYIDGLNDLLYEIKQLNIEH